MAETDKTKRLQADLALAMCTLLWGATFVVVKAALAYASVFLFLAVRFSVAALVLVAFRPRVLRSLNKKSLTAGLTLGFILFVSYAFQTAGLQFTTPSKSAFITGSSVILVPLLLALLWRRGISAWAGVGALSAFAGLYLLTVPQQGLHYLNRGDLLTLISAVAYATHIIFSGEYTRRHGVAELMTLQVASCAVLSWIATAAGSALGWELPRFASRWELWAAVVGTAVFATAAAFSLQLWAQRYTSSSHAAILFTLEPVFAAMTSYFVIGERMGGRALAGAAFALGGILLAELTGTPVAAESPMPSGDGQDGAPNANQEREEWPTLSKNRKG